MFGRRVVMMVAVLLLLAWPSGAFALEGGTLGSADASFLGEGELHGAGASVAGAGDVNGDGYDDLLVGALFYGANWEGATYLILGGADGWGLGKSLGQTPIIRYTGATDGESAGASVAGAGDVNGDGFDDFLIGAVYNSAGGNVAGGAAYLVLGSATPASTNLSTAIRFTGEAAEDQAGYRVAGAGDVNGDGYDDMLVGALFNDAGGESAGAAYLVLGSANPTNSSLSTAIRFTGEMAEDRAGASVAGVGDVNGDGYADILIGKSSSQAGMDGGTAYLVLGDANPTSGSLSTAIRYSGTEANDRAGDDVAGAGDVNGDGYDDMLIGDPSNDVGGSQSGAAYVVLGSANPTSSNLSTAVRYTGEEADQRAGRSLAGAGDVNGDGFDDLVVGISPKSDNNGFAIDPGRAYVVLGSASPISSSLSSAVRYTGEASSDFAGLSLAGAGDVNGDGLADVLIGAFANDAGAEDAGAAYLLFGDSLSPHSPAYRERHRLHGNAGDARSIHFRQARAEVNFTAGALPDGDVSVLRHLFDPCQTNLSLAMPIWTVDSTKFGPDASTALRFEYSDGQVGDMNESNLSLWFRPAGQPCSPWMEIVSTVDVAHNAVSGAGLGSGDYTLADQEPPTVLGVQQLGLARSGSTGWVAVLPALVILALGVVSYRVRQRAPCVADS